MSSGIVESQSSENQEGAGQQQQGASRSKLVQRLLAASSNLPAFVNDLLTTQAVVVAGTEAAAFLIERQPQAQPTEATAGVFSLRPIAHIRPDNSTVEQRAAAITAFQEILKPCVIQSKDGAVEIGSPDDIGEPQYCLITLLRNEGQVVAVSAVITRCRNLERARQRLISMQLVAGYFELYSLRRGAEQSRVVAQSHQHVLQLATAVATAEGFESAAMNLANELATRTGATRVSIGWKKRQNVRVKALSNTEKFDKKQELILQIEKVMEECYDQEEIVQFDPSGNSSQNVTRASAEFSRLNGGNIVLSLPLRKQADLVGVVTLEFPGQQHLAEQAASGLAIAVDLLAPQLQDRYLNDRWLIVKAGHSVKDFSKLMLGPKHTLAKLLIFLGIVAVLVLFNLPHRIAPAKLAPYVDARRMYRVSAPFQFVPTDKHLVSAPQDGHIWKVSKIDGQLIAPGMKVTAGQVLAEMDVRDLRDKLADAEAEIQRQAKEAAAARNAKPEPKIVEEQLALTKLKQAEVNRNMLLRQIDDGQLKAPIDGEILSGDLRDKVGMAVKAGDVLFEVADRSALEVELSVNDADQRWLREYVPGQNLPGSTGWLATKALPSEEYPFYVKRIVPQGVAKEGANVFKVYATIDAGKRPPSQEWRPGMLGDARIDVDKQSLGWIWTHKVVDFLRLKFWTWGLL